MLGGKERCLPAGAQGVVLSGSVSGLLFLTFPWVLLLQEERRPLSKDGWLQMGAAMSDQCHESTLIRHDYESVSVETDH